jgi:hypothetical protein
MKLFVFSRDILAFGIAAAVAGCAGQANTALPLPQNAVMPALLLRPESAPPPCKGQQKDRDHSSVTERLSTKGGSLCIPTFAGFGGALQYPDVKPSVAITVTSTNIDFNGFPSPGQGNPIDYLQLNTSGSPAFGTKLQPGLGLTGKTVESKTSYTAFSSYFHSGLWHSLNRCYAVARQGLHGGVIDGLGSLLKDQTIPGTLFLIEVYPGRRTSEKC